jgi:hypothetical protein
MPDFSRVSAECRELRQTVSDLIQYRKWEELRRQCDEEDRRGWENVLDTRIAAAEQRAREQVSQLRAGLYDEIESGLAHKVGDADLRNSSSPIPMDVEKPTIGEFLGQLKSNGGLEESRHAPKHAPVENGPPTGAPDERQNPVIPGNSQDPPTGPKQWREKIARTQWRSKQSKTAKKNNQTPNTKHQQLEAYILEFKENIRQKEQARKGSDTHGSSQSNGNEWRVANRKRPANRKTQTLRIQGKYKLVIGSLDDRMSLQSRKRSRESRASEPTGYRWKLRIRIPEQKATVPQSSWWNNFHGGNTPGGSTVHQLGDISQRSKTPRFRIY